MNTKPDMTRPDELLDELSQVDEGAATEENLYKDSLPSAVSLSIEGITTFPISQLGKYVVTCEIGELTELDFQKIQKLAQSLDRWWNSDGKFFVLVESDNTPKIRFERMESEDDNELL